MTDTRNMPHGGRLTPDDILRALKEFEIRCSSARNDDIEAILKWVVEAMRLDDARAEELSGRLEALFSLVAEGYIEGWAMPSPSGREIIYNARVIGAAASLPLMLLHGRPAFDERAFKKLAAKR